MSTKKKRKKKTALVICKDRKQFWTTQTQFWQWVRDGVVVKTGDRYRPYPLPKALEMLDYTWDNYFKYNNPEPEQAPIP